MKKEKVYVIWANSKESGCVEYDSIEEAIKDTEHSQYAEAIIKGNEASKQEYTRFRKAVAEIVNKRKSRERKVISTTFKWIANHCKERTRQ